MNKIQIALVLTMFTTISSNTYAGSWVNWDIIMNDISQSISSIVSAIGNFVTNNKISIVGTGIITTKQIAMSGITSIKLAGLGSLIITQKANQAEGLTIEADEAIMPYIDVQIKNNELIIKTKENVSFQLKNPIIYRLNNKSTANIDVAGAISVELIDYKTDTLRCRASGSSQISGNIFSRELHINSSGACSIALSGAANTQIIQSSGSGTFDGQNLIGKNIDINGSGAVKLYCNASNSITGSLSGSGSLFYNDSCPSVNVNSSGTVSIKSLSF